MYIIASKNMKQGIVGNDTQNLHEYTELGWELVGMRLDIIRKLQEKEISQEDVIVTIADRMFLYTKIFKNVISYQDFSNSVSSNDKVWDMAMNNSDCLFLKGREFVGNPQGDGRYSKYYRFKEDFDLITSFDFPDISHLPINEPYYVVCLRFRSHHPGRNSNHEFWNKFLNQMTALNKTVFIVGRGAESKANGKNLIYIDSLSQYASLINHKNCRSTIGTATGTMLLAHFCCKNRLFVVDHLRCTGEAQNENNAVLGGHCVRFMDIPYNYVFEHPKVDDFIKSIL